MVLAPVVRGRKGEYGKLLEEMRAQGYARAVVDGELRRLDEASTSSSTASRSSSTAW